MYVLPEGDRAMLAVASMMLSKGGKHYLPSFSTEVPACRGICRQRKKAIPGGVWWERRRRGERLY